MAKQVIVSATPLLIHNTPEAIQYSWVILDFIMLAQYISHDNKMLRYIEYVLYRLKKTNIAFEHHRQTNYKLYQPIFNYLKFHAISYLV